MVRTVITPNKQIISFEIPQSYVGKEIEVIAFTKDEGINTDQSAKKKVSFTALSFDTRNYKFNRDEANER
ncbi:hypothetical protein HH214_18555 [Mucilaginibacter robiniae]|uniref:Uncharacterized protein n=1 Tax=Mucilaginibacter robiniae TaxID=2728022 RepID=A0A7L5EA08_9SPHI|nr:hypothetical protein [Mucilaginibacter robiniae]QJD97733.1 hypothetical protein HH214_18555 [Mucilaginibacter robiniae]